MKRNVVPSRWLPVVMTVAVWLCAAASAAENSATAPTAAATTSPAVTTTVGSAAATTAASAETPAAKQEPSFMDAPEGSGTTGSAVPSVGNALARLVGALLLIGALLLGGLVLFKRFAGRTLKLTRGAAEKPLRVVEKISFGARNHVCLLSACGRYLVIGVTDKEINVLMEVTLPGDESAPKDFAALLGGAAPEKRSAH